MDGEDIASIARGCQQGFVILQRSNTAIHSIGRPDTRNAEQLADRFDQWAGNMGAYQPRLSPSSLEQRLRNARVVRESILRTLQDLRGSLNQANDILSGNRVNRVHGQAILDPGESLSDYNVSSSESSASSSSLSNDDMDINAPTSELEELLSAVKLGLDTLFKSSIFIRSQASKDQRRRAMHTKPFDSQADKIYLSDRYPLLAERNAPLVERLGEANARRRQYFKYRRDHTDRLSHVTNATIRDQTPVQAEPTAQVVKPTISKSVATGNTKPSVLASTKATTFVAEEPAKLTVNTLPTLDAVSTVSFATTVAETSDEDLPFPPLPDEALSGSPYLCPYCLKYIQPKTEGREYQWKKHVLDDLEPYVCTFATCDLETYSSQHTWFEHELLFHRVNWVCSECSRPFESPDLLKSHHRQRHSSNISDRQLPVLLDQSKRPVDSIDPNECPFCDENWANLDLELVSSDDVLVVTLDEFRRHLGQHLQKTALFALPRLANLQDKSLDPHGSNGTRDPHKLPIEQDGMTFEQDVMSSDAYGLPTGRRWRSGDYGRGWYMVYSKWRVISTFGTFLTLLEQKVEDGGSKIPMSLPALPLGLTEVHCSPDEPEVDIIFVHGLNEGPSEPWTTLGSKVFWPRDLLPSNLLHDNVRVLIYHYSARFEALHRSEGLDTISNQANDLISDVQASRMLGGERERPIIFIAHSTGGILVKQALVLCNQSLPTSDVSRSVHGSTYGMLFFGTPSCSPSEQNQVFESIVRMADSENELATNTDLPKWLNQYGKGMTQVDLQFAQILNRFRTSYFFEGQETILRDGSTRIVSGAQAAPLVKGSARMMIKRDHADLAKFESISSDGFAKVIDVLNKYIRDAPSYINTRREIDLEIRARNRADDSLQTASDSSDSTDRWSVPRDTGSTAPNQGSREASLASEDDVEQSDEWREPSREYETWRREVKDHPGKKRPSDAPERIDKGKNASDVLSSLGQLLADEAVHDPGQGVSEDGSVPGRRQARDALSALSQDDAASGGAASTLNTKADQATSQTGTNLRATSPRYESAADDRRRSNRQGFFDPSLPNRQIERGSLAASQSAAAAASQRGSPVVSQSAAAVAAIRQRVIGPGVTKVGGEEAEDKPREKGKEVGNRRPSLKRSVASEQLPIQKSGR